MIFFILISLLVISCNNYPGVEYVFYREIQGGKEFIILLDNNRYIHTGELDELEYFKEDSYEIEWSIFNDNKITFSGYQDIEKLREKGFSVPSFFVTSLHSSRIPVHPDIPDKDYIRID